MYTVTKVLWFTSCYWRGMLSRSNYRKSTRRLWQR